MEKDVMKKKKLTTDEKRKKCQVFMDELRNIPADRLSPAAKYWLKHEHDEPVKLNMRYVLR